MTDQLGWPGEHTSWVGQGILLEKDSHAENTRHGAPAVLVSLKERTDGFLVSRGTLTILRAKKLLSTPTFVPSEYGASRQTAEASRESKRRLECSGARHIDKTLAGRSMFLLEWSYPRYMRSESIGRWRQREHRCRDRGR